ncbi:MAG TPA: DUF3472 domain-containing protein [Chitinophagaceae bacterium]|nr:DUF3472 domain-containing protein [Chitinophagaceae bacterium]
MRRRLSEHSGINDRISLSVILTGLILLFTCYPGVSPAQITQTQRIMVPLGGNTWSSGHGKEGGRITDGGIVHWTNPKTSFTTYIRLSRTGTLKVWLHGSATGGQSRLEVTIAGKSNDVTIKGNGVKNYDAGTWNITDTGYVAIHLKGISKTGIVFARIDSLALEGSATQGHMNYVINNEGNFFYWGRRGPSVHMNYSVPDSTQVEWFYNEVTVPEGNDIIGSYFMADGFGAGYFGMQVNSPTERHILFSIWSPYKTDNPKAIPDSLKIQLLGKGNGVHAGEFGGEGSGGQSYFNFPWKAGKTYRFLVHCKPDGATHTIYTAYFYPPEQGKWLLIASFRRPRTHTYLKHLYSFLENFMPDGGDKQRAVLFSNQWIRTKQGKWRELGKALFTTDNTGRKGYRMDYAGGVKGNAFYLQNCGFFNAYTRVDTWFERSLTDRRPPVDLQSLPK